MQVFERVDIGEIQKVSWCIYVLIDIVTRLYYSTKEVCKVGVVKVDMRASSSFGIMCQWVLEVDLKKSLAIKQCKSISRIEV